MQETKVARRFLRHTLVLIHAPSKLVQYRLRIFWRSTLFLLHADNGESLKLIILLEIAFNSCVILVLG